MTPSAEIVTLVAFLAHLGQWYDTTTLDRRELHCLARNVYHEARGEPILGQIAVANVTLNRVRAEPWPDTVCGVVYQEAQFSWTNDALPDAVTDARAWRQAVEIATLAYVGYLDDQTDGATHYYNPKKANPGWAHKLIHMASIGAHVFLRPLCGPGGVWRAC